MSIKLNRVYSQILPHIESGKVRYFEIYGGRRSGKSFAVSDIITYIAAAESGHFVVAIRKYGTSLKDSVFMRIGNSLSAAGVHFSTNKTDKEYTLKNGSRIRCIGLDDPEKLKSLEGPTVLWFEEATEITRHDFDSLDAGLSPEHKPGRIFLTHNPLPIVPGSQHWIQERFLSVPHDMSKAAINGSSLVLRTWYKDNAFCPPETAAVLEGYKDTNPELYRMWALGEFVKLSGAILTNWDVVPEVPPGIDCVGYGLDFGFSADPAACVKVWQHADDIYIQGMVYSTGLPNRELYDKMVEAGVGSYDNVIADSAEPKSIQDLNNYGLRGCKGATKRANYKADMANALKSYKIHLVDGDNDLQREFGSWCWAKDKNGKDLPRPADGNDHYIDAFIMLMHERLGKRKATLLQGRL